MRNDLNKHFDLKDFSNLDNSDNVDYLICSMEEHYKQKCMLKIKQNSLDMLNVCNDDIILDAGCGLGFDSEKLAEIAANGEVFGVDSSSRMIQEAKLRSKHNNVNYCVADVAKLDFPDNHFHKCRMDRLLVSQKSIKQVLREVIRVLKPGGKLCITDLDFGTICLYPYIEGIVKYWQGLVENPFVGRSLPALFAEYGLSDVQIKPEVFYIKSYNTLKKIVQFEIILHDMCDVGIISKQAMSAFIKKINDADKKNEFFWSINLLTVVGAKK